MTTVTISVDGEGFFRSEYDPLRYNSCSGNGEKTHKESLEYEGLVGLENALQNLRQNWDWILTLQQEQKVRRRDSRSCTASSAS